MSKYGEPVRLKTKALVIDWVTKNGGKIGEFYDTAAREKIEREVAINEIRDKFIKGK